MAIVIPARKGEWNIIPQMVGQGLQIGMQAKELKLKEAEAAKYDQEGAAYFNEDTASTKENVFNDFRSGAYAAGQAKAEEYIRRREVDKNLSPGARLAAIKIRASIQETLSRASLYKAQEENMPAEIAARNTRNALTAQSQALNMWNNMGTAASNIANTLNAQGNYEEGGQFAVMGLYHLGLASGLTQEKARSFALAQDNTAQKVRATKQLETMDKNIIDYRKTEKVDSEVLSYLEGLRTNINPSKGKILQDVDEAFSDILRQENSTKFLNDVTVKTGTFGQLSSGNVPWDDFELKEVVKGGIPLSEIISDPAKLDQMIKSIGNKPTTSGLIRLKKLLYDYQEASSAYSSRTGPTNAVPVNSRNPDNLRGLNSSFNQQ
jgi:hypothetical protein